MFIAFAPKAPARAERAAMITFNTMSHTDFFLSLLSVMLFLLSFFNVVKICLVSYVLSLTTLQRYIIVFNMQIVLDI